jgi:hypothetical protein
LGRIGEDRGLALPYWLPEAYANIAGPDPVLGSGEVNEADLSPGVVIPPLSEGQALGSGISGEARRGFHAALSEGV